MRNIENAEITKDTGKTGSAEMIETVESIEYAGRVENVKRIVNENYKESTKITDIPQERILEILITLWADMYGVHAEQVERL